jgi:hypothetical protein
MKKVQNKFLPPRGFSAMMLFGFLFTRDKRKITERTERHESIHFRQFIEVNILVILLVTPLFVFTHLSWWWLLLALAGSFYIWYGIEWTIRRLFGKGNAYRNISFEREAYANEDDKAYLDMRKLFSFLKYIINS